MGADGGGALQVPLANIMASVGRVFEDAGRADFVEVAGELVLQDAVLLAAEVDGVAQVKRIKVAAAGVVPVEADAAITLNAAVHLMFEERAEVLVAEGPLPEAVAAGDMAGHHRHILKVALPPRRRRDSRADGSTSALDDRGAECFGLRMKDRDPGSIDRGVMQAITILPCVSFSSLNAFTAHCRQAPMEPIADASKSTPDSIQAPAHSEGRSGRG